MLLVYSLLDETGKVKTRYRSFRKSKLVTKYVLVIGVMVSADSVYIFYAWKHELNASTSFMC